MRIIALHRFFTPEKNPYGDILGAICGAWSRAGHDVTVLTALPPNGDAERSEYVDGVQIIREPVQTESSPARRLFNWIVFPLRMAIRVVSMSGKIDVVMCATVPQVSMGWCVSLAAKLRGAAFIYHCMDLHPEVGALSGEFSNPLVYRVLRFLDTQTMRRAERIVVLSSDMVSTVQGRMERLGRKTTVLNNFALPSVEDDAERPEAPLTEARPEVMRVVFTGNLGRYQGLDALIRAHAALPADMQVELVLMGGGRHAEGLRSLSGGIRSSSSVVFMDPATPARAKGLMRTADLGVVSLAPRVIRYAFPSKTATYLDSGLPVLVICETDSQLARDTRLGGYGFIARPGEVTSIREALVSAHNAFRTPEWVAIQDAARRAGQLMTSDCCLPRWEALLATLQRERE